MSRGILVSEKHGVNPSLGMCFWCGREDGTVLLLGRLRNDAEAPRQMCASYEPCDECKAAMEQGITIVECFNPGRGEDRAEMQAGARPTGRWCVAKREAAFWQRLNPAMCEKVFAQGKCFMDQETYEMLGFAEVEPEREYPPKG